MWHPQRALRQMRSNYPTPNVSFPCRGWVRICQYRNSAFSVQHTLYAALNGWQRRATASVEVGIRSGFELVYFCLAFCRHFCKLLRRPRSALFSLRFFSRIYLQHLVEFLLWSFVQQSLNPHATMFELDHVEISHFLWQRLWSATRVEDLTFRTAFPALASSPGFCTPCYGCKSAWSLQW